MKATVLALALAAGMLAVVIVLRGGVDLRERAPEDAKGAHVAPRQGPEAVLSIQPSSTERVATGQELSPRVSSQLKEFTAASEYRGLAQRLDEKSPRTGEENWMLAKLLEECAMRAAARASVAKSNPTWTRSTGLKRFTDSLSEKDPMRDKRIAAYEALNRERCEGVRMPRDGEVNELRLASAAQGEPKGLARVLYEEVMTEARNSGASNRPLDIGKHLDRIKAAMESGDPRAMGTGANLISMPQGNVSLRIGPDEIPVQADIFSRAVMALGCELGEECGPGTESLNNACAYQRARDVRDLREYYFFYAMSPQQSQLMHQYMEALRPVVRSRDWSQFSIRTGVVPLGYDIRP